MAELGMDGAPLPSPTNVRWHKVVSPRGTSPLPLVFLGKRLVAVWSHWNGLSLLCSRNPDCVYCKQQLPNRWTGYVASWSAAHNSEVVAALTEGAVQQLRLLVAAHGDIRGMHVVLQRSGIRRNAPVQVKYMGHKREEKLSAEFDVTDSLVKLFGVRKDYLTRTLRAFEGSDESITVEKIKERAESVDKWTEGL